VAKDIVYHMVAKNMLPTNLRAKDCDTRRI